MRRLALLCALAAAVAGEETPDLQQPLSSPIARRLREKALAQWQEVASVWEKVRTKQEITPEEAVAALPAVEEALKIFERAVREEWDAETNRTQADVARAWFKLREVAATAPPPEDEEARQAAEKEAERVRRANLSDARRFVMDYGRDRRLTSLFRRCPSCEGRKQVVSPFGDRRDCTACLKRGKTLDREALIELRWYRRSPLHRADARNEREMNRLLRTAGARLETLAPYVRSVQIRDVETGDVWARVTVREQVQPDPESNKNEKVDATYLLFRIGDTWYLYDERVDSEVLKLGEEE